MAGSAEGSRSNRRNEARQISQQKRAAIVESTRIFTGTGLRGEQRGVGGRHAKAGAPRICAVVALAPDVNEWDVARALEQDEESLGLRRVPGKSADEALAQARPQCELDAPRFRQSLQFLPIPYGALMPAMDACRCADFVVLLLSASTSIEPGSWGELCLRTLQAQGVPQTLAVVPTLHSADQAPTSKSSASAKEAQGVRKSLLSFIQYFCPDVSKVHALDEAASRSALVRTLVTTAPKRMAWRDYRAWLVAEDAAFVPQNQEQGLLKVQGWIRGAPLSANRLVHIPDFGDFAIDRITYAPHGTDVNSEPEVVMQEADDASAPLAPGAVLDAREEADADDLVSENEPDLLANEQTWPTEEEMAEAPANAAAQADEELPPAVPGTTPREILKRRAEKEGQRRYQAAWIIESDDEEEDDEDDEEEEEEDDGMDQDDDIEDDHADVDDEDEADASPASEGDDYDDEEELRAIEAYRAQVQREREAKKDEAAQAEFPDEVDTPMDVPARQRFARYRGLESMYTTYWDPYEDLPEDYARLFQFDDFSKTRKRVESHSLMEGVAPGIRVCLWVRDVPVAAATRALQATGQGTLGKKCENVPFVLFGLLRHEHKKSVIHFTVTRNTEYDAPVRSKDPLVVCLGFRRYAARPTYSQHIRRVGRRGNNVYKFERYLPHGIGAAVGSIYAPVTMGGASVPVVLLRMRSEGQEYGYDAQGVSAEQTPHLVGAGSVLDVAPTRILAKRIVLSGHPFKLHKKTATIRFMFFNADDVRYFAPITLRTKYGRTGHITESLGTHGYFKGTTRYADVSPFRRSLDTDGYCIDELVQGMYTPLT